MYATKIRGLIFTAFLLYFQSIPVRSNENIITNNSTLNNLYHEIFETNRVLIGKFMKGSTLKENIQLYNVTDQIFNAYYKSLTPREIETLKHKTRFVLETYSRIKDLLIHDIRNFLNFIRGKRSIDSLDRLVKIHVDIFTDLYDTWILRYNNTAKNIEFGNDPEQEFNKR